MSVLGFLLTAFLVYIVGMLIYFFIKIVLPIILTIRRAKKQSAGFYQQKQGEEIFNEGDISVEKPTSEKTPSKKKLKDDVGEVVDYQEVN